MRPRGERVLLVGVSTRAAAESAARAGFSVTALDAFADADQHQAVRALSLRRDFGARFSPRAAVRAARTLDYDVVAYLSSFENHPDAVRALAERGALWGNDAAALARVRDPLGLSRALRRRGLAAPATRASAPRHVPGGGAPGRWLLKPRASGGGHGVRPYRGGDVGRRSYLQERIKGVAGSVVFVAAGGRAAVLGVSRQLVGEAAFGATGFRYCGSVLGAFDDALAGAAAVLAAAVAEEYGLVGVNGVDFVARDGVPHAVEVNPRWSASMELVERARGVSVFGAHADACARGALPAPDVGATSRGASRAVGRAVGKAVGKAIVYARRDAIVGDTRDWLADGDVRDVPHPGERIAAGRPVCTVLAEGRDADDCHAALVRHACRVYDALLDPRGAAREVA